MSFEIREGVPVASLISDRRLYLTADKARVVEDGDPSAAYLLAGDGSEVPIPEAERLGLSLVDGRVVQGAAAPPEESGESAPAERESETRPKGRSKKKGG